MISFEALKNAASVLKEAGKIDEYQKIIDLQSQMQDLVQENWELNRKVTELEEQWKVQKDLEFRENAYWRSSGEGPFCLPCWDKDHKLMRMSGVKGHFYCHSCKYTMTTDEERRRQDVAFQKFNRNY